MFALDVTHWNPFSNLIISFFLLQSTPTGPLSQIPITLSQLQNSVSNASSPYAPQDSSLLQTTQLSPHSSCVSPRPSSSGMSLDKKKVDKVSIYQLIILQAQWLTCQARVRLTDITTVLAHHRPCQIAVRRQTWSSQPAMAVVVVAIANQTRPSHPPLTEAEITEECEWSCQIHMLIWWVSN